MKVKLLITLLLFIATSAHAMRPMTDDEIRTMLIKGNLQSFEGNCPCPYSKDKDGADCGTSSEYFRSRGKILCYPEDIKPIDVSNYRQRYNIPHAGPVQ